MLLAIDSGNTNVVFSVSDDGDRKGVWRCHNNPKRTADEYAVWLTQLMYLQGIEVADIDAAIIASVVPEARFNLVTLCESYFGCSPMLVGEPDVDLGIEILIDRPDQVGADRLANAVAAKQRYGGPLIIIDFGTATTLELTDADGNYIGGVIAPGINLSVDALYRASALLPRVHIRKPEQVIGKATVPAMQSGIFWGYIAMIEGLVDRIRGEAEGDPTVIATGGLAPLFAGTTGVIEHIDRNLTVRGLEEIYRRNRTA